MRSDVCIGLVVPFATDTVPDEGLQMYPGMRFRARGVGVRSLTPAGYDSAWNCDHIIQPSRPTGPNMPERGA